jgi:hypothetical protein
MLSSQHLGFVLHFETFFWANCKADVYLCCK